MKKDGNLSLQQLMNLSALESTMEALLLCIDPDPERGGLQETPERAAKAWRDWTCGYYQDPMEVLKVFEDGAEGCDEMVVVRDIPVYSHCEHHLAPIFGSAVVAYLPNKRIVGLSKINRLVNVFARRLQVQERLTNQIADALFTGLDAVGVGVVITARHMCMESRGIQQRSHTVTSALRGAFKEDATMRAEFLALARST
jgi:GTP cyclohydrolase I